jgi:hypothetical protein
MPQIENLSLKHTPGSDHKSLVELELERFENRLRTIQLGLEILTSVCATLPDLGIPPEDGDDNGEGEDVEETDGEEDPDDQMATDRTPSIIQSFILPTAGFSLHSPTYNIRTWSDPSLCPRMPQQPLLVPCHLPQISN